MTRDYLRIGRPAEPVAASGRRRTAGAAVLLLAGVLAGWSAGGPWTSTAAPAPAPPAVEALANGAPASYAAIVDRVAPAVVTIRSERSARAVNHPLPDHPLFREFFDRSPGLRPSPERRERGMGSGVIVRADGHILTNHHVVDGADQVTVELADGRTFRAKVLGSDQPSDLAVLKVDGTNLETLALGDSDQVRVGDVVLAVGNPLSVGQTVTMGIVSAKGRSSGAGDGGYENFIQTDAPINRGNSGGALVNMRGELVGINSQILTPSGGNIGIGFAIPANMARNVMTQLVEQGTVRRGRLGVTIQDITPDLAQALELPSTTGALVSSVEADSPAAAAGVQRGDVITAVNGSPVKDGNLLRNEIAEMRPGSEATLNVLREGRQREVKVVLGELSAARKPAERGESTEGRSRFGMAVEPLTAARARELGIAARRGLVITDVEPGSRAAAAGLRAGDVIELVDRRPVGSTDELRNALDSGTRPALLLIHRRDATVFVTLER